ncbi:MAG: DUF3565 domain-containing protein [Bdellovibrionales bacterium]|nr:DUF3565 domain-containing protein [Bdellovibrionales bacterium]
MQQKIVGFHLDEESHWVADLECGHKQHVRHDPPWQERPWVVTAEGRASRLGVELNCVRCDEMGEAVARAAIQECKSTLQAAYQDAGLAGLCAEGRFEAAVSALDGMKLVDILRKTRVRP